MSYAQMIHLEEQCEWIEMTIDELINDFHALIEASQLPVEVDFTDQNIHTLRVSNERVLPLEQEDETDQSPHSIECVE